MARGPRLSQVVQLHAIAEAKCHEVAHLVINIVHRHLGTPFFEYDASLVRDGCFFAGVLLAGSSGSEEEVNTCLQALHSMRWAFSKSEEREQALKLVWDQRMTSENQRRSEGELRRNDPPHQDSSISPPFPSVSNTPPLHRLRELPPPLSIAHTSVIHSSGPSTAATDDGGWTTLSNPSSHHSPVSASGSPPYLAAAAARAGMGPKVEVITSALMGAPVDHPVYYQVPDMEPFAYSIVSNPVASSGHDAHDLTPPHSSAGMSSSSVTFHDNYHDASAFFTSPPGTTAGRSAADASGSLPSDDGTTYHPNYTGGQFYVGQ